MITRRKIFGIIAGLAASVAALPAVASLSPPKHRWSGKRVHISMKVVGEDGALEAYADDSEIMDASLDQMRDMMSDYINHGTKE